MASASNYLKRRHRHHNANEMHRTVQRHWYWWRTGARSALLRSSHYLRTTLSGVGGRADERVRCALRGHGICAPPLSALRQHQHGGETTRGQNTTPSHHGCQARPLTPAAKPPSTDALP